MEIRQKWSIMRQHKKDRYPEVATTPCVDQDSPAIQHLIEQLDRDLEDTQRKASKAQ